MENDKETCEKHGDKYCFPCWEASMKEQFPGKAWND